MPSYRCPRCHQRYVVTPENIAELRDHLQKHVDNGYQNQQWLENEMERLQRDLY